MALYGMARQSNTLHRVAAAAGARSFADRSYRETIIEAAKTHSQADIARAAGVSKQAVSSLLKRATMS